MKLTKIRFALFALVVGAVAVPSTAIADGWFSEMDEAKAVTLGEVLRSPRAYVDVEVKMKVYFNSTGDSYNPYFTRFTEEMYGNFSAWPINARLYEKRDFQRSYPLFFMQRFHSKVWNKVQALDRMQSVEIHCAVREVFRGQPWIEVKSFRVVDEGLNAADVKNMIAGDAYYLVGRYDDAARRYVKVDKSGVDDAVRAELYRKQGDAQYKAGDVSSAVDSYEAGLRAVPESAVLKSNVAVASGAAKHARMVKRGKAVDQPLPEVAPQSDPVVKNGTNDVDEVIRILENPEDVKAETQQWRDELEKRAAVERARRNAANVTAVKGEDTEVAEETEASADVEEAKETDVEATEETEGVEEAVEEVVEEETVEEAEEGCGEVVEEVAEEAVEEVVEEESVEEAAEEAVEEVVEEETVEEAEEGCGEVVEEAAEEVVEEGVEETVEEAAEGCGDSEEVVEEVEESDEVEMNEEGEDAPIPDEDSAEEQSEETEASADETDEEVVEEAVEEVVEEAAEEVVEEPVEEVVEEATEGGEEVVEEEVSEEATEGVEEVEEATDGVEEVVEEEVVEEETAEMPEEEVVEEEVVEEAAEEVVEETADSEVVEEEEGVVVEEGSDNINAEGDEYNDTPAEVEVVDEDPRVVRVGERSVRVPRLPFFGCDEVTMDDLRAVLEEILRNPES